MDGKHIFNIDKWDEISYEYETLKIMDTANVVEIKGKDIVRKIVNAYMKESDDIERDEIWKKLYDDPSYQDLEKEKFRLENEIDELRQTIEQLENENDALRARR